MKIPIRYIELFAGIGGFRYGLEKANDTVVKRTQQGIRQGSKSNNTIVKPFMGTKQFACDRNILQSKTSKSIQKTMSCIKKGEARFTCVYANEWNKYACQIYRKNFGEGELYEGDIKKVSAKSIPDHDLLTAGFPCPSYSIAGKRKGFKDPRGALFFEICRIAKVKKPALLLLENVKGLLNHQKGETFAIILNSLSKLGYDCEWEVFNSAYYSVPQHRERVYIIGHLRGKGGPKIFPLGETMREDNASGERKTSGCVKSGEGSIQNDNTYIIYWKNSKEKWVKENRTCTTAIKTQSDLCRRPLIEHQPIMNTLTEAIGTRQGSSKEFIESVKNINKAIGAIRRLTPTDVVTEIGKRIARVQQKIF